MVIAAMRLGYRLSPSGKPHGLSLHVTGLSSLILPLLLALAPPLLLPHFTSKKRKMSQIHQHHNPTPKIIRPWYSNKEINGYGFTSSTPRCFVKVVPQVAPGPAPLAQTHRQLLNRMQYTKLMNVTPKVRQGC
jgi:hypothetical protein